MNIKGKKGVTLVEVVVTVAILAIIIVPISLVFNTAYSSFIGETDKVTAQQSARELLYGKGINSYGIMGDLERSNTTSQAIIVGDVTEDINAIGPSISIKDDTGATKVYTYVPDAVLGGKLFYKTITPGGLTVSDVDYFDNDKSSNGRDVMVNDFIAEKIKKDSVTDTDMIKITVTVACGKSGNITLESSYRFPNIEK